MEQQNGRIIQYVVNITPTETGEGFELVSTLNQLSLHPQWTYVLTVSGETSGVGPPNLAVIARTSEDGKAVVICNLLREK